MILKQVANTAIKTVSQFIAFYRIISETGANLTPQQFLAFKDKDGKTNKGRLEDSYKGIVPDSQITQIVSANDPKVLQTTVFFIPVQNIRREFIQYYPQNLFVQTNLNAYVSDIQRKLFSEAAYRISFKDAQTSGVVTSAIPNAQVYVWCRALNYPYGKLINVSPFVRNVSVNSGPNGQNFSLSLLPVGITYDANGSIDFKSSLAQTSFYKNKSGKFEFVTTSTHTDNKGKQTQKMFHNIIQQNDLVFISFEPLYGENREFKELQFSDLFRQTRTISNGPRQKIWDCIALVDNCQFTYTAEQNAPAVNVSGRDILAKALIDDGQYFFPVQYAGVDIYGAYNNTDNAIQQQNRTLRRVDGSASTLFKFVSSTVEEALSYVFTQMANIEVVPSETFADYENRSVYTLPDNTTVQRTPYVDVGVLNSSDVVRTYLSNNPLSNDQLATILSNKAQTDRLAAQIQATDANSSLQGITDLLRSAYRTRERVTGVTNIPGPGIWSIIKILVDDQNGPGSLRSRRLVDSSIAENQGSLMNMVRRICQEPFAESWTDTYGTDVLFIARKPPLTYKAYLDLIEISNQIDNKGQGAFHIRPEDVISENLDYGSGEIYSWYQITPNGNFLGSGRDIALAYLPAVYFPEIAEIYGNKRYQVSTNYVDFTNLKGNGTDLRLSETFKQAIEDLRFMIQTTMHNPFTRSGTITIKGDRRYKRGMVVRRLDTDEVCLIDNVTNSASFEGQTGRVTVLSVSHCMRYKDDVYNAGEFNPFPLYFQIVNMASDEIVTYNSTTKRLNWKVNRDVLAYFLQRKQWNNATTDLTVVTDPSKIEGAGRSV